jgi:four helix bundle protein
MPYEELIAFQVARELLRAVHGAQIADPKLRDQALRAAKSACLNIAEATGRGTTADQKRVYAIARGEASEAAAALDIAADVHECDAEKAAAGKLAARRLYALLGGLLRM